jgi:hypothetical protein
MAMSRFRASRAGSKAAQLTMVSGRTTGHGIGPFFTNFKISFVKVVAMASLGRSA